MMKSLLTSLSIATLALVADGARAADPKAPPAKAPPAAAAPAAPAAPAPPAAAPPAAAPAAPLPDGVVGPPSTAWKDMTKEQKGKFMKAVVMPKMKPLFTAFDADEFKKVDCATCHGKKAKAREFKMPNPEMYALPATKEGFAELMEKKANWMKFMGGTVKPTMAALLGLPEFNPAKPEAGGFGCNACHTTKKS